MGNHNIYITVNAGQGVSEWFARAHVRMWGDRELLSRLLLFLKEADALIWLKVATIL